MKSEIKGLYELAMSGIAPGDLSAGRAVMGLYQRLEIAQKREEQRSNQPILAEMIQAAIDRIEAQRVKNSHERGDAAIRGALLRFEAFENEIRGALVACQ